MFDEWIYRWKLRRFLAERRRIRDADMSTAAEGGSEAPDLMRAQERALMMHENEIDQFRSDWLVEQAYKYHVALPLDESAWMNPRYSLKRYLTPEAATKVRADLRAEQKASWDYWANRVTLALAVVGSIFGVLAYFKPK